MDDDAVLKERLEFDAEWKVQHAGCLVCFSCVQFIVYEQHSILKDYKLTQHWVVEI